MYNVLVFGMTENPGGVESFLMNYYRRIDRSRFHFDFLCNFLNRFIQFTVFISKSSAVKELWFLEPFIVTVNIKVIIAVIAYSTNVIFISIRFNEYSV